MEITINVIDKKGAELLSNCILIGIHELCELRNGVSEWGCGSMEIQDRVIRLQRILEQIKVEGN